jgi:type I restriction enzyme M protein
MENNKNADFKQTLWKTADSLRAQMDAAEYKHLVLGLLFLKYISDTFTGQKEHIKKLVTNPKSDFFINENLSDINEKDLEDRDYYTQDNVFWVPESARWETLRAQGKQSDIGAIIDRAMSDIETENKSLKGKLDKRFGRTELGAGKLGELIDLISTIGFTEEQNAGDMLGEVYEYFLGQFASSEGKKGGQFYTPRHVVKTLVAVLSPHKGRVYDPCCGSGGMFIQSEDFVTAHGGKRDDISIYGQESNPTTWRLAAMNLAIRGLSADLGKEPVDTFGNDQHPDTKFDYIIANPPFNISDWGGEKYEDDPRWVYGRPPVGNANYAWLQHMLWKLGPGGQAGVVLSNGSMSSNTGGEGDIRKAMIEGDVVEVMIALPGQLFLNTPIPVCLWFLTNNKTKNGRNRKQETLFIDARDLGTMETRVLKVFTDEDIQKIQDTVSSWRAGEEYKDIEGFCKSSTKAEIEKNNFILTPGRYVGFVDDDDDGVPFEEKISKLYGEYTTNKIQSDKLSLEIDKFLKKINE